MTNARGVRLAFSLGLAAVAFAWAAGPAGAPAHAKDRRFALVLGENASDDPSLEPLRFADDDALRWSELLGHVADEVVTLTSLDAESRRLWGGVEVEPPTRERVLAALRTLRGRMAKARAEGDRPVLWFVYSGHGNYDAEGRGYVHLEGGRFTTRDLYHEVIGPSGGDPVLLVVDACNAALLVHSRGGEPERRPTGPSALRLESWPNVGVVLASGSVGETHEWGRYLAGIFSHEVRSALLGPGDVDGDGRVTFAELAAFVASANDGVTNPAIKVTPYVRPPLSEPNLALVDLADSSFPARVHLGAGAAGKGHLADERLVRYADFHKAGPAPMWLALPGPEAFVLVVGETEYRVPAGAEGPLDLADLESRPRTLLSARGAASDYFDKTLFHAAYDGGWAREYLETRWVDGLALRRLVRRPWHENPGAWTVAGAGAAGLAGGLVLHLVALDAERDARKAEFGDQRAALNDDADSFETAAWALYGLGGAAVLGGTLWFALDRPLTEEVYRPPLEVSVTPSGVLLRSSF